MKKLENITADQRAQTLYHVHHRTCKKGFHGRKRCRFAKKSGVCNGTHCVLLEPITKKASERRGEVASSAIQEQDGVGPNHDDVMVSSENLKEQQQTDKKKDYKIGKLEPIVQPTYCLKSPLDSSIRKPIIVWELDRPVPKLPDGCGSNICWFKQQGFFRLPAGSDKSIRMTIINNFRKLLNDNNDTVEECPYNGAHKIWKFIRVEKIDLVKAFYSQCVEALYTANQYAVDHSVPLFYCTGSHNNTVLLGGIQQSKSAMFYIAPYMAKEKASLAACLTILEQARKEVKKFKSKADDSTMKPQERLAKHFLSKVTNKLNAYTELSDYQTVAYLLQVPSIITSELFNYSEPWGAMNYRKKLIENDDDDKEIYLGYIRNFIIEKGEDGNRDIKMAVPVVAMYFHRGKELAHLSLYEYDAMIQVKPLPMNEEHKNSTRSKWFKFEGGFHLQARFGQTLCAKQRTQIFKGKVPKSAGKRPKEDHPSYSSWKKTANLYANYILTMFRPCEIYKGLQQRMLVTQRFVWDDLLAWIKSSQEDQSVISKFRLMAVDRRMNCLASDFQTKKILSEYRARDADHWSIEDQQQYKRRMEYDKYFEQQSAAAFMDEEDFEARFDELDQRARTTATKMNSDAELFANSASILPQKSLCNAIEGKQRSKYDAAVSVNPQWSKKCSMIHDKHVSTFTKDNDVEETTLSQNGCFHEQNHVTTLSLNKDQVQIVNMYKDYLENPDNPVIPIPPPVVLLTGKGGTGKSFVIHALLEHNNAKETKCVLTLASNNLNAADIDGSTIASVLKQRPQRKDEEARTVQRKISQAAILELEKQHVIDLQLIIIDEISNVTASKLGELSRLFSESRGRPHEYFGGIPVLLVGDFNQKEPVGGILATTTLMKKVQNEQATLQQHGTKQYHTGSNTTKQRQYMTSTSLLNANAHNTASDSSLGSSILSASRWFELTVAERSKDTKHNENIDKLYDGMQIHLDRFHIYEFYNNNNLLADTAEERLMWLKAPVIVKTNRERCTINYSRGLQFAKATNAVLVRWNLDYSKWEGKPPNPSDIEDTIDKDAAFWEIFVSGGPCYLIDTISKERKLCNGTRAQYHSLVLSPEQMDSYKMQILNEQLVVTLEQPPIGINIKISDNIIIARNSDFCMIHDENNFEPKMAFVTVPICQGCPNVRERQMFIQSPNILLHPSRVTVKQKFPLTAGFALTVEKAQGQTLDRVILAISERQHKLSNFTYACLYVGNSRVKKSEHLRLLLHTRPNPVLQWSTLNYLTGLRRAKSIKAFFSGFRKDRSNWKDDPWDHTKALDHFD